tara:strand:- start:224 stop:742 length:519 start_codon:yes stop_codon:yes gene_type:complete
VAVRTISTLDPTLGAAAITVKMPEVKDFQKRIKFADKDVKKEARAANKDIADRVVQLARRNSWMAYHPRQHETMVRPTIRAVQGTTPKIKVGGAKIVRRPRYRGDVSVKADVIWPAVEFGSSRTVDSRGRRTGAKFGPRKDGGYVLFPTIAILQPWIRGEYTKRMEKILKGI